MSFVVSIYKTQQTQTSNLFTTPNLARKHTMRRYSLVVLAVACLLIATFADGFSVVVRNPSLKRYSSLQGTTKQSSSLSHRRMMGMSLTGLTEDSLIPDLTPNKFSTLTKRSLTGVALGSLAAGWVSSTTNIFGSGFLAATYVMHKEFTSMVQHTGASSIYKLGVFASLLCHALAAVIPRFHEFVLPAYFGLLMTHLVILNNKPASISQIAVSLLGVVYTGYLPSFWVRLHGLSLPFASGGAMWSAGAVTILWSWVSIASSDVGAYFVGNKFGRHKLSSISTAAGLASPNKSVEGALAGVLSSSLVAAYGAHAMRWPLWPLTGALYGLLLGALGLVGDLTASVMKRDAGVKDTGSLLPGHGGLLDRFDSYILSAPVAFLFVRDLLPWVGRQAAIWRG